MRGRMVLDLLVVSENGTIKRKHLRNSSLQTTKQNHLKDAADGLLEQSEIIAGRAKATLPLPRLLHLSARPELSGKRA